MISLILLKLFTFSQILQGVPKLLHATVYIYIYIYIYYKYLIFLLVIVILNSIISYIVLMLFLFIKEY